MDNIPLEVRQRINKIAKQLPPMIDKEKPFKRAIHGQSILNRDPERDVKATKLYLSSKTEYEPVNHKIGLQKAFMVYGEGGIIEYQKRIMEQAALTTPL